MDNYGKEISKKSLLALNASICKLITHVVNWKSWSKKIEGIFSCGLLDDIFVISGFIGLQDFGIIFLHPLPHHTTMWSPLPPITPPVHVPVPWSSIDLFLDFLMLSSIIFQINFSTTYKNVHDELGRQRGPGVRRVPRCRYAYDIITGDSAYI